MKTIYGYDYVLVIQTKFTCQVCDKDFFIDDGVEIGEIVTCPHCNEEFKVEDILDEYRV